MRVGFGYDAHRLVEGRPLILGGVEIPWEKGLLGHSDADVLVHAVMDALLGAAGLGDIGRHFPDHDPQYKDAFSIKLLAQVTEILSTQGLKIGNIDTVIVAEKPKLAPFIEDMRKNMALAMNTTSDRVNVKATTTEGMGFTGKGKGIAAYAIALLLPKSTE